MTRRAEDSSGMSLVELMVVVVIIGILAAISMVGYRKYIARARLSEATAMLAEFAAKEQLYFLENGQFAEAHNNSVVAQYPSQTEAAAEFWPQDPSIAFDSARTPAAVDPLPTSWRALGIRPRWGQLFCTYMVNAGAPPTPANPVVVIPGTVGPTLWASPPNVPWFYAMAACNLGGLAGWPNTSTAKPVTVLVLTHDSPAIRTFDEDQ
ncbi:MAG TPA: prepilin-type N-terminal cleavage/methylation domain-containing protein [Polyangia bacterium]